GGGQGAGSAVEDAGSRVLDHAGATVHQLRGVLDARPEVLAQCLVPQAHPEHRQPVVGAGPDHLEAASGRVGVARAGGDPRRVDAVARHAAGGTRGAVGVAPPVRLRPQVVEVAHDRVGEAVVVVAPPAAGPGPTGTALVVAALAGAGLSGAL